MLCFAIGVSLEWRFCRDTAFVSRSVAALGAVDASRMCQFRQASTREPLDESLFREEFGFQTWRNRHWVVHRMVWGASCRNLPHAGLKRSKVRKCQ